MILDDYRNWRDAVALVAELETAAHGIDYDGPAVPAPSESRTGYKKLEAEAIKQARLRLLVAQTLERRCRDTLLGTLDAEVEFRRREAASTR
jgi:hypothetical protein